MKIKPILSVCLAGLIASCSQISESIRGVDNLDRESLSRPSLLGSQQLFSQKSVTALDSNGQSSLVVPPILALPADKTTKNTVQEQRQTLISDKNYYVVVGTYPDSEQALETFVQVSSIGLPSATMESRKTKTGKTLHMVRLGPFKRQEQIDKVTGSLLSDGLSQFKVIES